MKQRKPDSDDEEALENILFDVHGEVYTLDELEDRLLNSKDANGKRRFWSRG